MAKSTAVYPEQIAPWVQLQMLRKNNITANGLVQIDTAPPFIRGGERFKIPVQYSLDNHTGMERITAATTVTPESIDDSQIYVFSTEIGAGLTATEFESIRRGGNANSQLAGQIATKTSNTIQEYMKYALDGIFDGTAGALKDNIYDGTSEDGGYINMRNIGKAKLKLGERGVDLNTIIVNSNVYQDLYEQGLTYVPATQYAESIVKTGTIPQFLNLRVLVNDTIATETSTGSGVYNSFLAGGSPFYLAYQKNLRMYDDFNPAVGGGTYEMYWYVDFGVAVNGVSYKSATMNPATTVLQTAASWEAIEQLQNIPLVCLQTGLKG
jgi:hypothetical protein